MGIIEKNKLEELIKNNYQFDFTNNFQYISNNEVNRFFTV